MLLGKELGPYVVEKELGSGAMGTVFRARHKKTGDRVAVKLMSPAIATSEAALARFVRESAILKQLQHPNIVRYVGSGRFHGCPFYLMEYVEGESLDHVMARRGRMTWEEVAELGVQLCTGLQHAHDKGIIHRDLKPSNIMVLRDGTVKLTDFGIAKDLDVTALTAANATVGTAAYMSPEQCRGSRDLTSRSDLYSMGVMFYELITGKKPFTADTAMEMFLKHANADFVRPSRHVLDLPVWLDNIICQLMDKKPEQRPTSASAVAEALTSVREKVLALKSAGFETAKKRRIDRTKNDTPLDEADKDAARALLGKKKKKKKKEVYRQNWFTIAGLVVIGLAFLSFIYVVFLKAPDAESLYSQAADTMQSKNLERQLQARSDEGEIGRFLYYHPNHPKANQMQRWADQIDAAQREKQMHKRRNSGFVPSGVDEKAELKAREALKLEEQGNLAEAARDWKEVAVNKDSKDPELRPWGLVAQHHLDELQAAQKAYDDIQKELQSERILNKRYEPEAPLKLAVDAVRAELADRMADAATAWDDLAQVTESQPENRRLFLLATQRKRELAGKKSTTTAAP